ncbi:oligosaccharide flippase family protein [Psychrobacter pacificensis]|uniref:oligosaccharide flippase family protein n=1 Tax=Psychrobacter pacificensis TaxID=112002 RepID=UPI001CBBC043|nr:oligosaccharide flippase family protein [Psychrobacter pacificensis]MBZ1392370.1 oligosaccharide flippase family protein [Psychrobacter pacificensis]
MRSFASLTVLKLFNLILPLLAIPYIARVVGVENYGLIAFSAATIVFFQTTVEYGFNYTAVRDVAREKDNPDKVSEILSSVITTKIFIFILCSILFIILSLTIPLFKNNLMLLLITFLLVPSTALYQEWFFQAIEEMQMIAFLSIISRLLYVLLVFLFVKAPTDYYFVPLFNALAMFLIGMASLYIIIFKYKYRIYLTSYTKVKQTLRSNFDMFLSLIAPNLYTNLSTILLTQYWGKAPTAFFDSGYKVVGLSQIVTSTVSRAFFPLLSRKISFHSLYKKINYMIAIISVLVLYFGAELFVKFMFGENYIKAIDVIKVMSITPIFVSWMNIYGTNYLVLNNKTKLLRSIIIYCSMLGLFLTIPLVYYFSYLGAAYSICAVWAIRGYTTMFYAKKNGA